MEKHTQMKKFFCLLALAIVCSIFAGAVVAQKPAAKPRDLFVEKANDSSKGKPGAKVRILLKRGNERERFVSPNETFYAGDKIKLAFDVNFSGHVALLNVGSSGRITMLYPYPGADSAIEPSRKEQLIPANPTDWITFDNKPGTEQITVAFSTNPIGSVQQVIEMSGQSSAPSAAASSSTTVNVTNNGGGSSTIYVATSSEAQAILAELNSRSLKRAKSRDLSIETVNDDATYVVADSSLISEPTAFVISLKHERR